MRPCQSRRLVRGDPVGNVLRRGGNLASLTGEVPRVELGERVRQRAVVEDDDMGGTTVDIHLTDVEEHDLETAEVVGDPTQAERRPPDCKWFDPRRNETEVEGGTEIRNDGISANQVHADDRPFVDHHGIVGQQRTSLIELPGDERARTTGLRPPSRGSPRAVVARIRVGARRTSRRHARE